MKISNKWKNWVSILDQKNCKPCEDNHGKIYEISEKVTSSPPLHPHCRCTIKRLKSLFAGEATDKGTDGADWNLKYKGKLPNYYVSKKYAYSKGWENKKGNLQEILPNRLIGGDVFFNTEGKLPQSKNRIWYEADIDYKYGYRKSKRILYSNDGLIFVTYNHYETFIEIR